MTTTAATDPEDIKIITLARASRARTSAAEGACVRDIDGRTYAASSVALPHLKLSAVAVATAMAVSSGAPGLEAVAVSRDRPISQPDRDIIADLARRDVALWHVDATGAVIAYESVGTSRAPEQAEGR